MNKEMQKQMSMMVAVPVTKEGRRLEAALGRNMEKTVKANSDALWARIQEENAKNEKLSRDRFQQVTGLNSNFMSKDLPAIFEKTVKKEMASVGQAVARAISPVVEKIISSAITESFQVCVFSFYLIEIRTNLMELYCWDLIGTLFQRGVGDKAVNQLDKSVSSKLEATVARQIQAQFQTTGKQVLQVCHLPCFHVSSYFIILGVSGICDFMVESYGQ